MDYGYYSDSDLEDDEDERDTRPEPAKQPHLPGGGESPHANHNELANKGKIVRIFDVAFIT